MDVRRRLRSARVELVDESRFWLRCEACGHIWSPNMPPLGRRLAPGYWKCPDGCNEPDPGGSR